MHGIGFAKSVFIQYTTDLKIIGIKMRKKEYGKKGKKVWKKSIKKYNRAVRRAGRSDLAVFGY